MQQNTIPKTLIFLHIPKTGGTTLRTIIDRQYKPGEFLIIEGARSGNFPRKVKEITEERLKSIKIMAGHMDVGIHEYLSFPATYFTLIRDPVDRLVSLYYFIKRKKADRHHQLLLESNITLKDFVLSGIRNNFNNGQTRVIAGAKYIDTEYGKCSKEMLEAAKDNLHKYFSIVGTTERFDETIMLLKKKFNWHLPLYGNNKNVARVRPAIEELPQETLEIMLELNQLDIELHEYAGEILQGLIETESDDFLREIEKFKTYNNAYRLLKEKLNKKKRLFRTWYVKLSR